MMSVSSVNACLGKPDVISPLGEAEAHQYHFCIPLRTPGFPESEQCCQTMPFEMLFLRARVRDHTHYGLNQIYSCWCD